MVFFPMFISTRKFTTWFSFHKPRKRRFYGRDLVLIVGIDDLGISYEVKHVEQGINQIYFSSENLYKGLRIGFVAGLIALKEVVAIGRTFAPRKDYQVNGNKEMIALGAMNVVGSMTSVFVATGSFTRSAESHMAGCQTAASNIMMSAVVFLTLKFLTPLFHYTPNAIFAPIIVSTVIGLVDYKATVKIRKVDKFDFVICLGTFLGVVFRSVQIGLLIGVLASVVKLVLQVTRPRTAFLGRIPTTSAYKNVKQYPEATKISGIVIVKVDSVIYFSNSNNIKERILRWLSEEEEQVKRTHETRVQ